MNLLLKELNKVNREAYSLAFSSTCRVSCCPHHGFAGSFLPMPSGIDTGQWSIEACIEKAIVHARLHAHSLLHIGGTRCS